jgi:hypothetical protein
MPTPKVYARMLEEKRETAQIVRDIRFDLAALLPNPQNWCADQWPVRNPADASMLAAAYTKLTDLLNSFDDLPDNEAPSIASGFQDIRSDLAEIMAK